MAKKKATRWKVSPKRAIEALQMHDGFVATAARSLKINHTTLHRMINEEPKVKEALDAIREETLDFVEGQLMLGIEQGKTAEMLFFLKTQGRGRGYIENPTSHNQTKIIIKGYSIDVSPDDL